MDTYLDTSDLALSSSGDITSDLNRFRESSRHRSGPRRRTARGGGEVYGRHSILSYGRYLPCVEEGQVTGVTAAYKMAMQQQEYQSKYNPTDNINAAFGMEGLGLDNSNGTFASSSHSQ